MKILRRRCIAHGPTATLLAGVLVLQAAAVTAEDASPAEAVFAQRVLPIFKEKCFACHGADPQELRGEFNMLTRESLLRGGESGEPAIVPGQSDASPLYHAVRWESLEMPPKANDRLSDAQVAQIKAWIDGGAPWPSEERVAELLNTDDGQDDGVRVKTSGGLTEDWTNRAYDPAELWAYEPLWQDTSGRLSDSARNPIDVLIEDRLKELDLEPASSADRRVLIRRATIDLLGLPPTPEEVAGFVNDPAPDDEAFGSLVDRLLDSPHYGEQWGQHWLDVVRYADSSGYANDYERGNAWRYRDYVVRAFNDDKPYDQFIREQLAGDEADPSNPEMLVAAGFLRMGPWELTGMEVAKVARQRFLDDVTNSVGQVFLAHMLRCARCHDHKFDPVPTRDYYSIQAVFATTQLVEREAAFLPEENTGGFSEKEYLEQRQESYQTALVELEKKRSLEAARSWYRAEGRDASAFESAVRELAEKQHKTSAEVELDEVRKQLARQKVHPDLIPPRHVGFEPADFGLERVARKGLERLRWRLERYEPKAFSVYSGRTPSLRSVNAPLRMPREPLEGGELEQTCILAGGDLFSPQESVSPGVLSVVEAKYADALPQARFAAPHANPDSVHIQGRRLALAEWISSPENPLVARVMVNRIWQWHFGQALAGNPNNFGATGKKPTHPELLDWLAGRFIAEGWSIKAMHRLIMSSQTYQRASQHPHPEEVAERDPHGTSYARYQPRRLTAEELRDAILHVSGELNPAQGGIPVRPEMNQEVAFQPRQVMGTFAEAWQPSPRPEQRHRRSIYVLRLRGLRDPFLEVFNAPSPDDSCEAREASVVTPQVFALFNSEIVFDRALALAVRVLAEDLSREDAIQRLFALTFGRPADPEELRVCLEHWAQMTNRHEGLKFEPPEYPREVVREAVEENTGEAFTFVEPLEFFTDFVPDLKPSDVDPTVRGLAEVCLVLLNSNEFAFVY